MSLDDNEVLEPTERLRAGLPRGSQASDLLYRAPTEPGSSGGAVFDENWELVGMHVGRGSDANFGTPIAKILGDARPRLAAVSIEDDVLRAIRASLDAPGAAVEDDPTYFSAFVSYSHADSVFANRLHNALQAQGIRAWLDVKQMLPGDDIYEGV